MVRSQKPVYLFLGQDTLGPDGASLKNTALARLQASLPKETRDLNIDTLYVQDREFSLKTLQEKLLNMPAAGDVRLVIVHGIEAAKADARAFLLSYVREPDAGILLVLDAPRPKPDDDFIEQLSDSCQVVRFRLDRQESAFALSNTIERRQAKASLEVLHRLLEQGEKPERIIGGLRSSLMRRCPDALSARKRLKVLLQADLDIKTGRLKPGFALEKMVLSFMRL
ncbi:MAG: hypothetical protein PHT59_02735 [Candidatus Omnitrophica bacterium]|nr:hypothetical protein [Candidatus Omnitrophota bacterium]